MEKADKIRWAKQALAERWHCTPADFNSDKNIYLVTTETFFEAAAFGSNAVMCGCSEMMDWCREQYGDTPAQGILDGDNLYRLENRLRSFGKRLAGEHLRYLHLYPQREVPMPKGFTYKWFEGNDVQALYYYRKIDNILNYQRDVLALAAFDGREIAAVAGTDDYREPFWQLGIDTRPAYRNRGLASWLVKQLALEVEQRGRLPFYTTWSPNLASTKVALQTGFYPVWVSYFAENIE